MLLAVKQPPTKSQTTWSPEKQAETTSVEDYPGKGIARNKTQQGHVEMPP